MNNPEQNLVAILNYNPFKYSVRDIILDRLRKRPEVKIIIAPRYVFNNKKQAEEYANKSKKTIITNVRNKPYIIRKKPFKSLECELLTEPEEQKIIKDIEAGKTYQNKLDMLIAQGKQRGKAISHLPNNIKINGYLALGYQRLPEKENTLKSLVLKKGINSHLRILEPLEKKTGEYEIYKLDLKKNSEKPKLLKTIIHPLQRDNT